MPWLRSLELEHHRRGVRVNAAADVTVLARNVRWRIPAADGEKRRPGSWNKDI